MTDHHDVKLRELTFKLMHMAPDAPPFPETPMTTLTPQRTPERQDIPPKKRTWNGPVVAAGAFALVLLIALPAMLLRGGDADPSPPATNPPVTTVPPTTTPNPTVPPTTTPTTSLVPTQTTLAPSAALIGGIWSDIPGSAPLDGSIVVASPLVITGRVEGATEVSVNGAAVPVTDDFFEATVELTAGVNGISIGAGSTSAVFAVTYIPDGTVEFAFLTNVTADGIVADYAQWLTGIEANQAAIEDGDIPEGDTVPNDYYIRNQNPQLRTLPLAGDVAVMLPTSAFGSVEVTPVIVTDWLALFKADGSPWNPESEEVPPTLFTEPHFGYFGAGNVGAGYWLTLDTDGNVVQIVGQYRP